MDYLTGRSVRQAMPVFLTLSYVLLVLAICTILVLGKNVLVHIALGILLSFALTPIVNALERLGLGRALSVTGAILLALGMIAAVSYVGYSQASRFAADLPGYEDTIRQKISGVSKQLAQRGAFSSAADVISRALVDIEKIGEDATAVKSAVPVVRIDDEAHGIAALGQYLEPVFAPIETLLVVLLLTAFLLGERESIRNRLLRVFGTEDIQQTTAVMDDAGRRVGRMLLTQIAVNTCFGIVIGAGLWAIGLPSPFLWGILAGILRFVPFIGAIIGVVPPLIVAFAVDPGWSSLLLTLGLFVLIEPLLGHVIEPLLYGHSSGLSPVAIILAAAVWAFLWGPVGLVMSTPLTICLVVLGRYVGRLQFLEILLGDRPALEPHEIFYQRMLAGDPREAQTQARLFLKDRTLFTYYDEIALAAARRAHLDIVRGSVSGERLKTLVDSTNALVDELADTVPLRSNRSRKVNAEAAAALELIGKEAKEAKVFAPPELKGAWANETPVAVLHGTDPLDAPVARMLAQVCSRQGLQSRVLPLLDCKTVSNEEASRAAFVFICFVEPLSRLHLRAYLRRVKRAAPQAQVAICIWQETDAAILADLRKKLHGTQIATTTAEAFAMAERAATLVR